VEKTPVQQETRRESDLQSEVEWRLAEVEPDVDVLLVESIGVKGSRGVRVFLDRPAGVDHELCVRVTRHVRDLLADYTVEVSSPGPSRPLTKLAHYRRFVGHRVRVRTNEAIDGRSELKGELTSADEDRVVLSCEWGTVTIPHDRIRRANLVPQPAAIPRRR
jgi:ribosome maturation factor RimP